jgi:hypothetical protein
MRGKPLPPDAVGLVAAPIHRLEVGLPVLRRPRPVAPLAPRRWRGLRGGRRGDQEGPCKAARGRCACKNAGSRDLVPESKV